MKTKQIRNYTLILLAGLALGWVLFHSGENKTQVDQHDEHAHETIWTCSMHPQIKMEKPGKCPICSMDLIPLVSGSNQDGMQNPDEIALMPSAAKLADIQTQTVQKGMAMHEMHLQGKIQADERNIAQITARFGGRIEKLFINFTGQEVTKGEKLATIYSPELVSAQKELLEARKMKDSSPALYSSALNKLKLWDLTDEQIRSIENAGSPIEYFDVLAPVSGTVSMRMVATGDYVKQGSSLFQLIDLSKVWVMLDAYESDLPWLHVGNPVNFTVSSIPGESFSGKVTFIDPVIDARTRVARIRLEMNNAQAKLKPEMFVNALIQGKTTSKGENIIIPRSAILWTGKRSVVYVKVPGRENPTFSYREIVLGPESGDNYIVSKGLSEGEEIAVNGVFKIDAAAQLEGKHSMMQPKDQADQKDSKMVMINIRGECEMCKDRIEAAVKNLKGVQSVEWNQDSKMAHLMMDPSVIKVLDLHKAFAGVGHDTDQMKADDSAYNALPDCCLYR